MFSEHLNRYFNEPNEFLQELQSRFLLEQLRWLPLKWLTRCNVHARDSLPYPAEFFYPYSQSLYGQSVGCTLTS